MEFCDLVLEKKGNHFSEIDRQKEWVAVESIKCKLLAYMGDTAMFDKAKGEECAKNINYARDVGTLNPYLDETNAALNFDQQTCTEKETTFLGKQYLLGD